jgi:hypothetical protein
MQQTLLGFLMTCKTQFVACTHLNMTLTDEAVLEFGLQNADKWENLGPKDQIEIFCFFIIFP